MIQNLIMYGLSYRTHYTLDQREDRQINNYNVTGAEIDRCTAQCGRTQEGANYQTSLLKQLQALLITKTENNDPNTKIF